MFPGDIFLSCQFPSESNQKHAQILFKFLSLFFANQLPHMLMHIWTMCTDTVHIQAPLKGP